MTFELLPTIDAMIDLYRKPISIERFQTYLKTLHGDTKGDLVMPIAGFNPMAKEHLLDKLFEFKKLNAEKIIAEILNDLNHHYLLKDLNRNIKVAINIADDLKGGWTNRFTSDYDSKFKFNGIFSRDFCTPFFWASEKYTEDTIKVRTLEYIYRTIYWITFPKPQTLKEHLDQEIFVANKTNSKTYFEKTDFNALEKLYNKHKHTDNYTIIFNFFYGDNTSVSLAFPTHGVIENFTGFDYAKSIASI